MMDDLIKKDLLAHKIYSSWQFIKYTEKNIDIVHYDCLSRRICKGCLC